MSFSQFVQLHFGSLTRFCLLILFGHLCGTVVGVLDAEIEQLDGVNFAKPRIGLLPVYNFPNYPTTGDIPAVQVHGAWFRVNPVHPSAPGSQPSDSTVVSDLRASNLSLSTQIQDLQRQLAYSQHHLQKEKESRVRAEKEVENLRSNLSRSSSGSFSPSSPTIGTKSSQMKLGGPYLSSISFGSISSLTPAKTHSPTSASSTATILSRPQNAPLSTLDSAAYIPESVPSPVQSPTIARPESPKGLVAAAVAKGNAADAAAASGSHRAILTHNRSSGSSSGLMGLKSPSNTNFSSGSPTAHSPSNSNPSNTNTSPKNLVGSTSSSALGGTNVLIGASISLTDLKVSSSAKLNTTPLGLTPPKSNIDTPAVQLPVTILAPVGGLEGLNPHSSAIPASGPSKTPTTSQPSDTYISSSSSPLLASNPALPSSARPTISPRTPTSTNKSTNSITGAVNRIDTRTGDEDELSEPYIDEEDLLEPGEGFGEIWVAAWAFNAFDEHDTSFVVGDRISIINKKSTDWWVGRVLSTGQEGLFPANHLGVGPLQ